MPRRAGAQPRRLLREQWSFLVSRSAEAPPSGGRQHVAAAVRFGHERYLVSIIPHNFMQLADFAVHAAYRSKPRRCRTFAGGRELRANV